MPKTSAELYMQARDLGLWRAADEIADQFGLLIEWPEIVLDDCLDAEFVSDKEQAKNE